MEIEARSKPVSAKYPLPTADMTAGSNRETITTETVTFVGKAAAGSVGINALDKKPILNLTGDKVGSYWGRAENRVWRTGENNQGKVTALTETATAADITILDRDNDLELLFESATTSRFVIRVFDTEGGSLYGFIEAVAASNGSYTFDVYNSVDLSAQSWIGTLADFDNTKLASAEIYSYETSITWTTGTVLTKEVAYNDTLSDVEFLKSLNNGEYGVDYENARILYKRATTGASDTITYTTPGISTASVTTGNINVAQIGGTATDKNVGAVGAGTQRVTEGSTTPQAYGVDAVGADTYTTVVTASGAKTHIYASLKGANDAIISLDSGTTDHIYLPANSAIALDAITIASGATIQGKNASAGNNYTNLAITIW